MKSTIKKFTTNVTGLSGISYPIYFECETFEQAERLVRDLDLDNDGVYEMKFEGDWIDIKKE